MNNPLPYLIVTLLIFSSCVSMKKYDAALAEQDRLRSEIRDLRPLKDQLADCKNQRASVQNQLTESISNYEDLLARYQDLNKRHIDLGKKFEDQVRQNSDLLENSSSQVVKLYDELDMVKDSMAYYRKMMNTCETELALREAELDTFRTKLDNNREQLEQLQDMLSKRQEAMDELRNTLREALVGFSAADLSISQKDGRLYVSMSQELLFKSGSDQIDKKGREAIEKLAVVLQSKPDMDIIVEGHTDSDGAANYNWDLSVKRATQVVKILAENQVSPDRITASGRGEHHPIATNDTSEGKAKNRRTEIIIAPELNQLYKLMYNDD